MSTFKPVQLYGGAITVELPSVFGDVSLIRQVPDNQEVWLDGDGFTSIIFELTERLDESQASNDEEALRFHFADMVEDGETKCWQTNAASLARMPNRPAYSLVATQHPAAEPESRRAQPDMTVLLLVLARLAEQKTDILITINVPHMPGEYPKKEVDFAAGKQGPLVDAAASIQQRILQTLEIKDFGLFGEE